MNKPTLVDGLLTQELPTPKKPTRKKIYAESSKETLGGKTNTDKLYWKYQYELEFDTMTQAEYDLIEAFIDDATDLRLSWVERWPSLQQTAVKARLNDAQDFIGSGQNPYIKCSMTIIEIEARG